tara:strand:- start:148 stop:519 length:372 start_codon:yes stop_codon:yes gene_type:complete
MKKFFLSFFLISFIFISCDEEEDGVNSFKGKLVKKGICKNYVIEVNDSDFPQDLLEKKWTDESSNKKFNNVFRLHSICDFPDSLKENDSFNFIIDSDNKDLLCAVCYAYTPTPEKSVSITVLD